MRGRCVENRLQRKIVTWLKDHGFYVLKTRPGMGIPVGCPDIIALKGERFIAIEVKASAMAEKQPGQLATLRRLGSHNPMVFLVYPENWDIVRNEIEKNALSW